mgnify:CR=1 FL=1
MLLSAANAVTAPDGTIEAATIAESTTVAPLFKILFRT